MTHHDWNAHYAANELPWDTGQPEPLLVEAVEGGLVKRGRALEIGCGTGTDALWLAAHGFDVLASDIAPLAIARASEKARTVTPAPRCRFMVHDFLAGELSESGFQFVFDRGCFHAFSEPREQAEFAARVARLLAEDGVWLSLVGSTEGPVREGPPRRSARDITNAIEPVLELVNLRAIEFAALPGRDAPPRAWFCLSRRRAVPAQPSTRY